MARKRRNLETPAVQELERQGLLVWRASRRGRYQTSDAFDAFDIIAIDPVEGDVIWVQVTSDSNAGARMRKLESLDVVRILATMKHNIVALMTYGDGENADRIRYRFFDSNFLWTDPHEGKL